jgi:hypothetical protein
MLRLMKFIIWLVLPPIHYQYNSIKTMKTSVMGAINTLGLAKRGMPRYFKHQRGVWRSAPLKPKVIGECKPNWDSFLL